jgi:Transcription factor WhiB
MVSYCQRTGGIALTLMAGPGVRTGCTAGSGDTVVGLSGPESHEWELEGLCRKEKPEVFFPQGRGSSPDRAKAICRRCPVRMTCLETALEREEPIGIWGGMTTRERRRLLRQRHLHERFGLCRSAGTRNIRVY